MAGQLADELGPGYEDYLAEAVYLWIQEASAKLEKRLQGLLAPPLVWMGLGKRPGIEEIDQQEDSEPEAPKGEHHKKLVDEGSLLQQGVWAAELRDELELCSAPRGRIGLSSSPAPPSSMSPPTAGGGYGRRRRGPPGELRTSPRGDEPCGRTILKAVCWMERVAEFDPVAGPPHTG